MTKALNPDLFPSYEFHDGDPVYLFTNENIYGTLKTAGDLANKKILTVGASGDHVFESYLLGAGDVHTFDINSNQKNVIELKNHMIRNLPYDNFMDFFFSTDNFFNQNILTPIRHKLSDNLRNFLKKCSDKDIRGNFKDRAAINSEYEIKRLQYISNESNYNTVRDRLPERIPFQRCSLSQLANTTTQKYDLILLSNIFDYLYSASYDKALKLIHTCNDILTPLLTNNITPKGRIYFEYLWDADTYAWVNFLNYFQTHNAPPIEMVARSIDPAFKNSLYDAVLYATRRQK
jgi:hypothetical protein